MSAVIALARPRRIKASHRRRRRVASDHLLYILNNPLAATDPSGYSCTPMTGSHVCGADTGAKNGQSTSTKTDTVGGIKLTTTKTVYANGGSVTTVSGRLNGASGGQGTSGTDERKNQVADTSDKNSASNRSTSSNGSSGSDQSAGSLRGVNEDSLLQDYIQGGYYTDRATEEFKRILAQYPQLRRVFDVLWKRSFDGVKAGDKQYRREYGALVFENTEKNEIRFIVFAAHWRKDEASPGFKDAAPFKNYAENIRRAGMGEGNNWNLAIVFHTHPFDACGFSCGPNQANGLGPSDGDQKLVTDIEGKGVRGVTYVVREIVGRKYQGDGKYQDLFYGSTAPRGSP